MAFLNLSLHSVQAWNGANEGLPPAEGLVFQIAKVTTEPGKEPGKEQMVCELMVVSEGELKGRKAFGRYSVGAQVKQGALGRVKQLILATHVQLSPDGGFDDQQLVGTYFMADSVHETYDKTDAVTGNVSKANSVKIINERTPVSATPAAAAAFAPAAAPAAAPPVQPQYSAPPAQPQYAPPAQPQYAPPAVAAPPAAAAPWAAAPSPQHATPYPGFSGGFAAPSVTPVGR